MFCPVRTEQHGLSRNNAAGRSIGYLNQVDVKFSTKRRLCEEMRSRTRGCTCCGMPDGLTGPRGLAPSGKDPPWHPNPSPAAAHLARLLEGRNGMGDAWLAQTRFRCDSGVPVLPTTRIPLEARRQTEHSLSTGLRRTRLSLPLGTQGPVPAVGLKPQERRASACRACVRRMVKMKDDV